MNWINKIKKFGESIKRNINKKFPTKSERESSAWTSCCKGPILKKELEENLFVCPHCNKHHRINPIQRFGMLFDKSNYNFTGREIILSNSSPASLTEVELNIEILSLPA